MKKFIISFFITMFCSLFAMAAPTQPITDYHAIFIPGYNEKDELQIAIRMYYLGDIAYFLAVDPNTFITRIMPAAELKSRSKSMTPGYFTMKALQETSYLKALEKYSAWPYPLRNDGLTQAEHSVSGEFLTIDMCPSSKPFEKDFFNALVALANKTHRPVPIAIAMSGLWMMRHPQEFNWLLAQQKAHKLDITWVNHSFSHVYYADLPLDKNFMLDRPDDFTHEILEIEKMLLASRQLPSVFFRFPGLVSDKALMEKLKDMGLIAIGTNAWLAKGEAPTAGSVILVHGNGNEPEGIKDIMPRLQKSELRLLPLSQAVLAQ